MGRKANGKYPKLEVDKDGTRRYYDSLWINGRYVPDPRIRFTEKEKGDIQASIKAIEIMLAKKH